MKRHPDCDLCYKCVHIIGTELKKVIKGTFDLPVCNLTLFKSAVIGFEGIPCRNFKSKE